MSEKTRLGDEHHITLANGLPDEVWEVVVTLGRFNFVDLICIQRTCKELRELSRSNRLWAAAALQQQSCIISDQVATTIASRLKDVIARKNELLDHAAAFHAKIATLTPWDLFDLVETNDSRFIDKRDVRNKTKCLSAAVRAVKSNCVFKALEELFWDDLHVADAFKMPNTLTLHRNSPFNLRAACTGKNCVWHCASTRRGPSAGLRHTFPSLINRLEEIPDEAALRSRFRPHFTLLPDLPNEADLGALNPTLVTNACGGSLLHLSASQVLPRECIPPAIFDFVNRTTETIAPTALFTEAVNKQNYPLALEIFTVSAGFIDWSGPECLDAVVKLFHSGVQDDEKAKHFLEVVVLCLDELELSPVENLFRNVFLQATRTGNEKLLVSGQAVLEGSSFNRWDWSMSMTAVAVLHKQFHVLPFWIPPSENPFLTFGQIIFAAIYHLHPRDKIHAVRAVADTVGKRIAITPVCLLPFLKSCRKEAMQIVFECFPCFYPQSREVFLGHMLHHLFEGERSLPAAVHILVELNDNTNDPLSIFRHIQVNTQSISRALDYLDHLESYPAAARLPISLLADHLAHALLHNTTSISRSGMDSFINSRFSHFLTAERKKKLSQWVEETPQK